MIQEEKFSIETDDDDVDIKSWMIVATITATKASKVKVLIDNALLNAFSVAQM